VEHQPRDDQPKLRQGEWVYGAAADYVQVIKV